jgi:UDP-glucose 6-dehydrogenase
MFLNCSIKQELNLEIYDPQVSEKAILNDIKYYWKEDVDEIIDRIKICDRPPSFNDIDAAAILTEWEEFKELEMDYNKVFDGRRILKDVLFSI